MNSVPGSNSAHSGGKMTTSAGTILGWVKVTKTFADFSAAALFKELTIYALPAGGVAVASKVHHTVAFTGGGATSAILQIGKTGVAHRGDYMPGFDVFQAAGDQVVIYTHINQAEDHVAPVNIIATLNSDVNLNGLAAGSVDIWLWVGTTV